MVTAVAAEADSVAAGLTSLGGPAPADVPLPGGFTLRRLAGAPPAPSAAGAAPGSPEPPPDATYSVVDVLVAGVGPAAAAVGAATALAHGAYDLVVSAGIAGGFPAHAPLGAVVVSDEIVAADLGAQTQDGYLTVEELGFGRSAHPCPAGLTARIARALADGGQHHLVAPVLTVSTVTGTAARAAELAALHPRAAAEAMEGFGAAEAAAAHGVPVVEIRAVSNAVGPRDRAAWRIGQAMDSLRHTFQLLSRTVFVEAK